MQHQRHSSCKHVPAWWQKLHPLTEERKTLSSSMCILDAGTASQLIASLNLTLWHLIFFVFNKKIIKKSLMMSHFKKHTANCCELGRNI